MALHRHAIIQISVVVEALQSNEEFIHVEGFRLSLKSSRIRTYSKGTTCVCCGLEGAYFAAEVSHKFNELPTGTPHLNLYALKDGVEVLMTSDHIIPKFLNGSDSVSNRQVMCAPCNHAKGHTTENIELALSILPTRIKEAEGKLAKLSRQQQQKGASLTLRGKISSAQHTLRSLRNDLANIGKTA